VITIQDLTRRYFDFVQPLLHTLQKCGIQYKIETSKENSIDKAEVSGDALSGTDTIIAVIDEISQISFGPDERIIYFPVFVGSEALAYNQNYKMLQTAGRSVMAIAPESGIDFAIGSVNDCLDLILHRNAGKKQNRKILIDAGPTIEDIDPVRFISNRSTGKMGLAMARAAFRAGYQVAMVSGPVQERIPGWLENQTVRSSAEMAGAVQKAFPGCDWFIAVAAVADFRPALYHPDKIKKQDADQRLSVELGRTTDILSSLSSLRRHQKLIGFSVETNNVIENSLNKMRRKGLDAIIVNNPLEAGSGFASETNRVSILWSDGRVTALPLLPKLQVAEKIISALGENL